MDATTGHESLTFMDGSLVYNQIRMYPVDEELMAFRTPKGVYCYKVIPFGLKNVSATNQSAMQKIFDDMLHKNFELYQLKMSPLKCAFGVTSGKFLGFVFHRHGIEIEQAKIDYVIALAEPHNMHEFKRLQG
ncbi:hypothetical protein LIER_08381 [Lithospermum erythrorhizon]|uniref:Reverse transcriptase domain-containing protein n=1 Tax=Lithospermum erythrorhizon TaxID=34254 RepID=A0AAV3PD19_LITER